MKRLLAAGLTAAGLAASAANAQCFGEAPTLAQPYTAAEQEVLYRRQVEPLLIGADNNLRVRDYEEARAVGVRFASPANCAGLTANADAVLEIKRLLQAFGH